MTHIYDTHIRHTHYFVDILSRGGVLVSGLGFAFACVFVFAFTSSSASTFSFAAGGSSVTQLVVRLYETRTCFPLYVTKDLFGGNNKISSLVFACFPCFSINPL